MNKRTYQENLPKYKNVNLSIDERTEDLLKRMTLDEKVAQMQCIPFDFSFKEEDFGIKSIELFKPEDLNVGIGQVALPSIGKKPKENAEYCNKLQKMFVEGNRLGIPVIFHEEGLHGHDAMDGTCFPSPLAMASTWEPELISEVTESIAEEIRSRGGHLVFTPNLDLARDPRWGRTEETFGEDPYLVSCMGVASIKGFQGDNESAIDKRHVCATIKHFAAHGNPESGINIGPPNVDEDTLNNIMFPPFKAAVEKAKVKAVMASYNEINGIPSHANKKLLTDVLRKKWGFKGIVVSDWFAIEQLIDIHFIAKDEEEAGKIALNAGVDIDLPKRRSYNTLSKQVKSGEVDEYLIDQAVRRLLKMKFQLGLFEDPYVNPALAEEVVGNSKKRKLALKVAQKAITLLKNNGNILPIKKESYKKIAVVGPFADECIIGNYAKEPKKKVTPLDAIRENLKGKTEVIYSQGVKLIKEFQDKNDTWEVLLEEDKNNLQRIKEAVQDVKDCEIIILCIGANEYMMREGYNPFRRGDNANLKLRCMQEELVKKMAGTGKPVVTLLFNGGPLCIQDINESVSAMIECWFLGQETGYAVADVLFGEVNPSGKLPITIPRTENQLPVFYNRKPSSRFRGYLFDDNTPLYGFGYGLSYTTFEFKNLKLNVNKITQHQEAEVSIEVSNTGDLDGEEIVQLYIRDIISTVTRPVLELKGFQKVYLKKRETKTVSFKINRSVLGYYNTDNEYVVENGDFNVMLGNSSQNLYLSKLTVYQDD